MVPSKIMLPNPDSTPSEPATKRSTIFFENKDLDEIARHFIGNNERFFHSNFLS